MSIGAWLSAEYQHEPGLYCDAQARRFVFAGKAHPPAHRPFDEVAASLTVEAVLAAAGLNPAQFRFEQTPVTHHAFADLAGRAAVIETGPLHASADRLFLAPNPASFTGKSERLLRAAEDNRMTFLGGKHQ